MATILIVDDNPASRSLLVTLLGYFGHRLLEARDGAEALKTAQNERPDLIITDVVMPVMDGYELVHQLRADPVLALTRVFFCTAHYREQEALALAAACGGVSGVLAKGCDPEVMLAAVQSALKEVPRLPLPAAPQQLTHEHLHLLTDKLYEKVSELTAANEQMQRLAAIVQNSDDAIISRTLDGIITSWNPGAERLFGYTAEEAVGKGFAMLVPPDRREEYAAIMESLKRGEQVNLYETVRLCRNHSLVDLSLRVSPLRDATGKIVGAAVIARDISERKRAEEALRDSETRHRAVLESAHDAIISADSQGNVVEWNNGARAVFGYTAAEIRGKPLTVLMPERYRDAHEKSLRRYLATGESRIIGRTIELVGLRKNGTQFPLEISLATWTTAQGRFFMCVARDVTERKSLEDQFRQAQKMEAIGSLAAGVAHDFNNLLTVVSGYSDLLLAKLSRDDPMRTLLKEINLAGERAAQLTRQLLAFRKQVLEPKVLDLNAVVAANEKMLRRLIGEDVNLKSDLEPSLGRVKADPGQIEQVIMNLAVNARDAMPQGGESTIQTANVQLDERAALTRTDVAPGSYALLAVRDTGCGMDEATRARIFEPFFTTKEPGMGTGLGLATVYGIVKQSGGHVEVESEPGKGTAFRIYLPQVEAVAPAGAPREGTPAMPRGKETVLLVEDKPAVRALARHILQMCGYSVLEAAHGCEGVQICQQHPGPIHLLISDVVMPRMSGRQLAERITALKPGIKVLFISGYTDDAILRHGIQEAQAAFLRKPFTPSALARKVRETLDAR